MNGKLAFTRRAHQSFVIGNDVTVTVESVDGGNVRITVQAPRHVPVVRSELLAEAARQTVKA